jgi:nitrile hydratase accessory protein
MPTLPRDGDGPAFSEPWQAEAFALAVKLNEKGLFTWTEWAEVLGRQIGAEPRRAYFENWLAALEEIVQSKKLMSQEERLDRIAAWDRAARATPHGQPIVLVGG